MVICKYCSTEIDGYNIAVESGQNSICTKCVNLWQDEKEGIVITPERIGAHIRKLNDVHSILDESNPVEEYIFNESHIPSAPRSSNQSPRRETMANTGENQTERKQFQTRVMSDEELGGVTVTARRTPVFTQYTQAKVLDITANEAERKPAPSGDEEVRINIRVHMQLPTPVDGQTEFYTNYGVRMYVKPTGERSLYWGKSMTDAMSLRDMVSGASGIAKDSLDIPTLKNYLVGKTVYVKSEQRSNPTDGSVTQKALIKQIKLD